MKLKLLIIIPIAVALIAAVPAIIYAATSFNGGTYIVSNTNSPAWGDPVNANIGDVVQFKVDIINNGSETATNVRVKADFPNGVSGNSIASTIHIVADNAPEVTDGATVNITNATSGATHSLVYFPGHAVLITNSGQSAIESIGGGGFVSVGDVASGQSNYVEVTFKAKVTETAGVVTPPPPAPAPAPPPPAPAPPAPAGQSQSQTVNVTQTNTNTNTNTVNTTAAPAPTPVPQVLGVKSLPKTGLPLVAWSALGLIPAGLKLRKFSKVSKDLADNPSYIWKKRSIDKEA